MMMNDKIHAAVVSLANAAYRMGAKDACHLCRREAERIANAVTESAPGHEQALGAAQVLDEINAIDPSCAMPDFSGSALVALGAPTSDGTEQAEVDIMDMVVAYLEHHGYDGLYSDDCGCELSDLAPCGDPSRHCRAGYCCPCPDGEHDMHIGPREQIERVDP